MRKIRVLVVDDSVVIRRLVTDVLSSDPNIEVIGSAANGRIAMAKIPQVNPDLVTLDIEMPEMDGLETLAAIRKIYPFLPVIMFSTLTERGASATLDALSLGANDYVTKPANVGGVAAAMENIREGLIPKIKAFCSKPAGIKLEAAQAPVVKGPKPAKRITLPRPDAAKGRAQVDVLAIGTSTGGPNALGEVIPMLPADLGVPVVIVQHMPPLFTKLLADRLEMKSPLKVREGTEGGTLQPGEAWLAPGDFHMVVANKGTSVEIQLNQAPPENSCRPAVDVLFRSVVEVYGSRTLAVVMTGMGQDGLRGCEYVREAGGQVLVQDEATSIVWGMPGAVAEAGLHDRVLPLDQIGPEIVRRIGTGSPALRNVSVGGTRS